jgi:hypothetical protein
MTSRLDLIALSTSYASAGMVINRWFIKVLILFVSPSAPDPAARSDDKCDQSRSLLPVNWDMISSSHFAIGVLSFISCCVVFPNMTPAASISRMNAVLVFFFSGASGAIMILVSASSFFNSAAIAVFPCFPA